MFYVLFSKVVVKVTNALSSQVTSVHWHGLRMRGTPWMDGASGVSQCGILPGRAFTYKSVFFVFYLVIVKMTNAILSDVTSIYWHGLYM